jgi:hypothetical protein
LDIRTKMRSFNILMASFGSESGIVSTVPCHPTRSDFR